MLVAPHDPTHRDLHARWRKWVAWGLLACGGVYAVACAARGSAPTGGTWLGLGYGVAAAAIIVFELLLWPRKHYRSGRAGAVRTRKLGRTTHWMAAHVWLGLLVLPLALLHAGGRWGGPLPFTLLAVLAAVVLSGVYGLYLHEVLPRRLLDEVPDEVPEGQAESILTAHTDELVDRLEYATPELRCRYAPRFADFLAGRGRDADLGCPRRSAVLFAALRAEFPADGPVVDDLARLCDLRRQFTAQARLQRRLHSWVPVHLWLSAALVVLLIAHIVTALRFI